MASRPRRQWPKHLLVGQKRTFTKQDGTELEFEIVDVKAGPVFLDTSAGWRDRPKIITTIRLRLREATTGAEFWSRPMKYDCKTAAQNKGEAVADG